MHPVLDASHGIVDKQGDQYVNVSVGIMTAVNADNGVESIYSLSGMRLQQMSRGINIVRMADGTVKKILVK